MSSMEGIQFIVNNTQRKHSSRNQFILYVRKGKLQVRGNRPHLSLDRNSYCLSLFLLGDEGFCLWDLRRLDNGIRLPVAELQWLTLLNSQQVTALIHENVWRDGVLRPKKWLSESIWLQSPGCLLQKQIFLMMPDSVIKSYPPLGTWESGLECNVLGDSGSWVASFSRQTATLRYTNVWGDDKKRTQLRFAQQVGSWGRRSSVSLRPAWATEEGCFLRTKSKMVVWISDEQYLNIPMWSHISIKFKLIWGFDRRAYIIHSEFEGHCAGQSFPAHPKLGPQVKPFWALFLLISLWPTEKSFVNYWRGQTWVSKAFPQHCFTR